MSSTDDQTLARDLAAEAGRRLLDLRARGGDPDLLRKAGDRPTGQVHIGARPGQGDGHPGQPALGDVIARPVRFESRPGAADPLSEQTGHHTADVMPVACVLRPRIAQANDDPAVPGQPVCSPSPAAVASATASGTSGAPASSSTASSWTV